MLGTKNALERKVLLLSVAGPAIYVASLIILYFVGDSLFKWNSPTFFVFDLLGSSQLINRELGADYASFLVAVKSLGLLLSGAMIALSVRACSSADAPVERRFDRHTGTSIRGLFVLLAVWMLLEPVGLCLKPFSGSSCGQYTTTVRYWIPIGMIGLLIWATPSLIASTWHRGRSL